MKYKLKEYLKAYPVLYKIGIIFYGIYLSILDKRNQIIGFVLTLFFPLKNDKIVICNYYGKGYGDNAKYIVEEIIKQNLNYDIVWMLKGDLIRKSNFPNRIRVVKYGSFKALFEMATAKIWIDNCRKSFYPPKRKNQFYIQTWHGGIALKKVEKDVEDKLAKNYIKYAKKDSKMADLFLSNSKFCSDMYRRAFWYRGDILECGSPRVDILFSGDYSIASRVKEYFGLEHEAKILLYAPTFRKDFNLDCYDIDFVELLNFLESKYNAKWYVFLRLHPNIPSYYVHFLNQFNDTRIINVTDYDDMYELMFVSDILITDYSSTMFEFSFVYKPVFIYASDVESYKNDRNFYFNITSLPYSVARNNEELLNNIKNFDQKVYYERVKDFMEQLEIYEKGDAAKQVVEEIKKRISN